MTREQELESQIAALTDRIAELEAVWKHCAKYGVIQGMEYPTGAWITHAAMCGGQKWKARGVGGSFAESILNLQEEIVTEADFMRKQEEDRRKAEEAKGDSP